MGSQLCGFQGSHKQLQSELLQKSQIQNFLLRYPLIEQKFKLYPKHLPNAQFESITKNKNSVLFKSSVKQISNESQIHKKFHGIIFQQAEEEQKKKYYNALCYQGQFNEFEQKQGLGFTIFDNGDTYQGTWKNNLIDGNGKYSQQSNNNCYQGQFNDWKKQGRGKLISNIDKKYTYEGQFKNNQFNGHGVIQFEDGSKYDGDFKKGFQEGSGIYQTKSMKYEGTFKKGVMSGAGSAVWFNQKGQIVSKYTGQYLDGKKHGFGQYEIKNGKLLRGQWFQGKFNPGANSYIIQ